MALYGKLTVMRNRLALTDEDEAEYGSFESLIATCGLFGETMLCLCIFHGVWQPFKEKVFTRLPKKSARSKELSSVGEDWGKCS